MLQCSVFDSQAFSELDMWAGIGLLHTALKHLRNWLCNYDINRIEF